MIRFISSTMLFTSLVSATSLQYYRDTACNATLNPSSIIEQYTSVFPLSNDTICHQTPARTISIKAVTPVEEGCTIVAFNDYSCSADAFLGTVPGDTHACLVSIGRPQRIGSWLAICNATSSGFPIIETIIPKISVVTISAASNAKAVLAASSTSSASRAAVTQDLRRRDPFISLSARRMNYANRPTPRQVSVAEPGATLVGARAVLRRRPGASSVASQIISGIASAVTSLADVDPANATSSSIVSESASSVISSIITAANASTTALAPYVDSTTAATTTKPTPKFGADDNSTARTMTTSTVSVHGVGNASATGGANHTGMVGMGAAAPSNVELRGVGLAFVGVLVTLLAL